MYKCPFCQSTNCDELKDYGYSSQVVTGIPKHSYNDELSEFVCNECGIVTKIDPRIYKEETEE